MMMLTNVQYVAYFVPDHICTTLQWRRKAVTLQLMSLANSFGFVIEWIVTHNEEKSFDFKVLASVRVLLYAGQAQARILRLCCTPPDPQSHEDFLQVLWCVVT